MARLSLPWVDPLADPLAVAAAGLLLVLLTRLTSLGLPMALLIAVLMAEGLAMVRAQGGRRGERLRDRRVRETIDGLLQRATQLAIQAGGVSLSLIHI